MIKKPEVEFIPLDDIQEDDRQRHFYDEMKIVDLADDIAANGIINPLSLREHEPILVTGGRRLRALRLLQRRGHLIKFGTAEVPLGHAPCIRAYDRDRILWLEVELSENIQREDLTWQERAAAVANLHALRQEQGGQSVSDTTREIYPDVVGPLGGLIQGVNDDLKLADYLDDPDIAKAKTKKDAVKALKLKKNREHHANLAELFDQGQTRHLLLNDDAVNALEDWDSHPLVDVIVTDPPYGIDAQNFGNQTVIDHTYDDDYAGWINLLGRVSKRLYTVAKGQAHLYMFCDVRRFFELQTMLEMAGWKVWDRPLIWDKGNTGTLPRPEHGPRLVYECILFANKGDKRTNHVAHDVIRGITSPAKPRHAAEKPVELYMELLRRSAKPGDVVLDPFAGSGPIFPAANALRLQAIGIELEKTAYGICTTRLEEVPE